MGLIDGMNSYFEKSLKLNMRDPSSRSPIFYAVHPKKQTTEEQYDLVEFLLRNGSEPMLFDKHERTPLHYACMFGADKRVV